MTSTPAAIEFEFSRLPAAWHRFPRIFFGARPVVDDLQDPPQITASVASVPLASARIRRFREVCGYAESAPVPLTYPHIIAMPLHLALQLVRNLVGAATPEAASAEHAIATRDGEEVAP